MLYNPPGALISPLMGVRFLALLLAAQGFFIKQAYFRRHNWRQIIGLEKEERTDGLKTGGMLLYMRHLMYAGTLLVLLGFCLYKPAGAAFTIGLMGTLYIYSARGAKPDRKMRSSFTRHTKRRHLCFTLS